MHLNWNFDILYYDYPLEQGLRQRHKIKNVVAGSIMIIH